MNRHVYTPNVVISVVPLSVQEVIGKISSDRKTDDQLLFRVPSDNILSFTHEYLFSEGNSKNIGNEIDLRIIDPESLFLKKFIGNNLGAQKASQLQQQIYTNQLGEAAKLSDLRNRITQLQGQDVTLSELIDVVPEFTSAPIQGIIPDTRVDGGQFGPGSRVLPTTITEEKVKQLLSAANLPAEANADVSANPNPYLYFYYGLGNNPKEWAGPVAGQIVAARYNYSPQEGRKEIQLRFTSTYDFAGFSYLNLDNRGTPTNVVVPWRCIGKYLTQRNDITREGSDDNNNLSIHETCIASIKDYLQKITSSDTNIIILLPDIAKMFNKKADIYKAQSKKTNMVENIMYSHFVTLNSLGFDVAIFDENDIEGLPSDVQLTSEISLKSATSVPTLDPRVGYEKDFSKRAKSGSGIKLLAIKIRKEGLEKFIDPLKRIETGINNIESSMQFLYEVYDNPRTLQPYFDKVNAAAQNVGFLARNRTISDNNKNFPTFIFGTRDILEFLFYGKAIQLSLASGNDAVQKYITAVSTGLSKVDKDVFDKSYIATAADNHLNSSEIEDSFSVFPSRQYELSESNTNAISKISKLKDSKVFFLKYGVQEPNVLDFNININDYFFSLLTKLYVSKDALNLVIDTPGDLITLSEFTNPDVISKIEEELNITNQDSLTSDIITNIQTKLKEKNAVPSPDELKKIILYFSTKTVQGKQKSIIIPISSDKNEYFAYYTYLKNMMMNAYVGTVKTLPVFRFSKVPTSLPYAFFLAEEPKYVPYSSGQEDSMIKALNGFWSIIGFRHVISNKDIFSEFKVIKQFRLGGSNLLNPVSNGGNSIQVP